MFCWSNLFIKIVIQHWSQFWHFTTLLWIYYEVDTLNSLTCFFCIHSMLEHTLSSSQNYINIDQMFFHCGNVYLTFDIMNSYYTPFIRHWLYCTSYSNHSCILRLFPFQTLIVVNLYHGHLWKHLFSSLPHNLVRRKEVITFAFLKLVSIYK